MISLTGGPGSPHTHIYNCITPTHTVSQCGPRSEIPQSSQRRHCKQTIYSNTSCIEFFAQYASIYPGTHHTCGTNMFISHNHHAQCYNSACYLSSPLFATPGLQCACAEVVVCCRTSMVTMVTESFNLMPCQH